MRALKRFLVVVVPVVVLALTPAATAAGGGPGTFGKNTTTVAVKSAQLVTGGAVVTLRYDCFPGGYGPYSTFGFIRMTDAHGNQSFISFHPTCNDRPQTQSFFVPGKFTAGDAAVNATVCGFDCNADTREVRLH